MKRFLYFGVVALISILPVCADIATGSGLALSKKHVLTAYHVVDNAEKIAVSFEGVAAIKASVLKKDILNDWAVLELDGEAPSTVVCSTDKPQLGQKVYTLGFPSSSLLGEDIKYSDGVVSATTGMLGNEEAFQFSAPIQPGNSGGPLFDEQGRLIGIVQSTINPEAFFEATGGALPQNVNFGYPLWRFLDKISCELNVATDSCVKSVIENQKACCFIKVSLNTDTKVTTSQKRTRIQPAVPTQKEKKYEISARYEQLWRYLDDVINNEFVLDDGSEVDVTTDAGFKTMCAQLAKVEVLLEMEVNRNLKGQSGEAKDKCFKHYITARSAVASRYNEGKKANENVRFWGVQIGDKINIGPVNNGVLLDNHKVRSLVVNGVNHDELMVKVFSSSSSHTLNSVRYKAITVFPKETVGSLKKFIICVTNDGYVFAIGTDLIADDANKFLKAYERKIGMKCSYGRLDLDCFTDLFNFTYLDLGSQYDYLYKGPDLETLSSNPECEFIDCGEYYFILMRKRVYISSSCFSSVAYHDNSSDFRIFIIKKDFSTYLIDKEESSRIKKAIDDELLTDSDLEKL